MLSLAVKMNGNASGVATIVCLALAVVGRVVIAAAAFTTRSYDLDVPGSRPIRIIEADPGWNLNSARDAHRFEHRTAKPDVIANRNDHFATSHEDNADDSDNSEKLKKFLNSYAASIKNLKPHVEVDHNGDAIQEEDETNSDELILKDPHDTAAEEATQKPEKSKSWNLLHFDKVGPQQQQDPHRGWVSMEAVPWSQSKISKWHGKPKNKDKYHQNSGGGGQSFYEHQQRPYNDRFQQLQSDYPKPDYPKPDFNYRPTSIIRPTNNYYEDVGSESDDFPPDPVIEDDYYANTNKRPTFTRPTMTYGHKVNVHTSTRPQAGYHKPDCNQNQHQHQVQNGYFGGHQSQSDIITDGLPANFPDAEGYANRRRGVHDGLPSTHPFKGDGEWVLLSTTKGYKYPKHRQRSIQFGDATNGLVPRASPPPPPQPPSKGGDGGSISSHKSVRLTVLPPLNDGRVNMTTSHGGLLQVDATFQSVEDAQRAYAKRQKGKHRRGEQQQQAQQTQKKRPAKLGRPKITSVTTTANGGVASLNGLGLTAAQQAQIQNQLSVDQAAEGSSMSDSGAVLAAVGAGMIPAGMALLVPMAMSGKKRKRRSIAPLRYYPHRM